MTSQRRADWADRLPAIARMRKAGRKWDEIATYYGVSKRAILNVSHRFADQLDEHAKRLAEPANRVPEPTNPVAERAIQPELYEENGIIVKRFPAMWAEEAGLGRYTVKPKGKVKRND